MEALQGEIACSNSIYAKKDRNGPPSANQVASSESSRGFVFSLAHPLVHISDDDPSAVSWEDLDMQLQSPVDSRYDLGKLLAKVQFFERDHISANIILLQMQRTLKVIMPLRGSST